MVDKNESTEALVVEPNKNDNQPSSRFRSLLRKLGIALIVAALAALGLWAAFVRPVTVELDQVQSDLQAAQATISEQQIEISHLAEIEAQLAIAQSQRDLLGMLADVNAARFALAENDFDAAQAALAQTGTLLTNVATELGADYSEQVADMQARLALVNEEILGAENFNAQSDLEVLANLILSLETSLME